MKVESIIVNKLYLVVGLIIFPCLGHSQKLTIDSVYFEVAESNYFRIFSNNPPIEGYSVNYKTITVPKLFTVESEVFAKNSINLFIELDTLSIQYQKYKDDVINISAYYNNNKLHRVSRYNKFGKHGTDISYYINGVKSSFAYFENGILISPEIYWYMNGEIKAIQDSVSLKRWYKNGQLAQKISYDKSNEPAFVEYNYSESGNLILLGKFNSGVQPIEYNYENGKCYKIGFIKDVRILKIGKWKFWYSDGVLKKEISYHDSIPNLPVGIWKYYNENGELLKEEIYREGELQETKEYLPLNVKKE